MEHWQYESSYHEIHQMKPWVVHNFSYLLSIFSKGQSKVERQEVSKVGGIQKTKEIRSGFFPSLLLAHYGILSNLFAKMSLKCYICFLGVIYFYLPRRTIEWIKQGENQIVVEGIAHSKRQIGTLFLFSSQHFLNANLIKSMQFSVAFKVILFIQLFIFKSIWLRAFYMLSTEPQHGSRNQLDIILPFNFLV